MPGTGQYPQAIWAPINGAVSPTFDPAYPFRGVLHTTQSNAYNYSPHSYYGHLNPPHFTVVRKSSGVKVYQHFSINTGSRAMVNAAGGVETNRAGAIQIEIAWTSEAIASLPAIMKSELKALIEWISYAKNIQKNHPPFFDASQGYGTGAISRMSLQQWMTFNGWCGHQHVPENIHWDPGKIDANAII